jgi:hypothetical protein
MAVQLEDQAGCPGDIVSRYPIVSLGMIHAVQDAYPMFR